MPAPEADVFYTFQDLGSDQRLRAGLMHRHLGAGGRHRTHPNVARKPTLGN